MLEGIRCWGTTSPWRISAPGGVIFCVATEPWQNSVPGKVVLFMVWSAPTSTGLEGSPRNGRNSILLPDGPPPPLVPVGIGSSSCSAVWYSTVQHSIVQYSTVYYNAVQYITIQCSVVQYNTVKYSTVQYNTVQYSTGLSYEPQFKQYGEAVIDRQMNGQMEFPVLDSD